MNSMKGMLGQSLALQWRVSRWPVVPFVLAGFGLPLLALRGAQGIAARVPEGPAEAILVTLQNWTPLFPLTAALLGVTLGLGAWSWDHRGNHVYALSLPVGRWEYALLKFAAGGVIMLVPVAAVLAGVSLGLAGFQLPEGLHAYPLAFTLRFLLAALVVYALSFALAAGTIRTALWVISLFLSWLIFGTLAVGFAHEVLGVEQLPTPLDLLNAALSDWPGPFHVFGGNWMPIDV